MLCHFPSAGEAPSLSQQKVQKRPWGVKAAGFVVFSFSFLFQLSPSHHYMEMSPFPFLGANYKTHRGWQAGKPRAPGAQAQASRLSI